MMVLGRCIRALGSHQQAVPYRESLITRLFKDFFKSPGKCAVAAVIVNVTPTVEQYEDTSFSLSFAVDASRCSVTGASAAEEVEIKSSVDPNFQIELAAQTQRYFDSLENCYRSQVEALMDRTRSANFIHKRMSEYILRSDYEQLQLENRELRQQLKAALEKISELTLGD
jgi:hypothetical protein